MAEAPEQGNSRLSQAQAQVGEVVDIMRVNVEKVGVGELDVSLIFREQGLFFFRSIPNIPIPIIAVSSFCCPTSFSSAKL